MPAQTDILGWGCVLLGAWLVGYALHCIRSGRARGYYQDHLHEAGDGGFARWVWGRLVLGLACLAMGLVVL